MCLTRTVCLTAENCKIDGRRARFYCSRVVKKRDSIVPYTDKSDLFASVHEDGVNRVVQHLMHQRPTLFNYATSYFASNPHLLCAEIPGADAVREQGFPILSVQPPLALPEATTGPTQWGLHFCLQLTDAEIDFHPGNVIDLPGGVQLPAQQFALRLRGCFGIGCPDESKMPDYIEVMERYVVAERDTYAKIKEESSNSSRTAAPSGVTSAAGTTSTSTGGGFSGMTLTPIARPPGSLLEDALTFTVDDYLLHLPSTLALPFTETTCFCIDVLATGYFEWGTVGTDPQQWLKPRLSQLELVELGGTLETIIECYVKSLLRVGILPRLMIPIELMVLNITRLIRKGSPLKPKQKATLEPSVAADGVPNNPAIEGNQLKAFVKLVVS